MRSNEHPQRLLAYLDGELSGPEARAVEEHLEGCGQCAKVLAGHERLHASLDLAAAHPVRGELWSDLEPQLTPPRAAPSLRGAGLAYLMVVLVGLGVGGWAGWSMEGALDEEDSPELLGETSLYDLPEDGFARNYLVDTVEDAGGSR